MTAPAPTSAPVPSPAASRVAHQVALDHLDEALSGVRQLLQRPGYRRRLLASLPAGTEPTTLRVVRFVDRASDGEAPSIGDVAAAMTIDPSSASRFVDQAVGAGYLERHTCARDRRRSRLRLTTAGRDLLEVADVARLGLLAETTDGWPEDDVVTLTELLLRLRDGLDRFEHHP